MTGMDTHLSTIALMIIRLNFPTKRHGLADCIKKTKPKQESSCCLLQETYLTTKDKVKDEQRYSKQMELGNKQELLF